MLYTYTIIFVILGSVQLLNPISIFIREKSFIYLPQLINATSPIDKLKYQAYTQINVGLLLILYAVAVTQFNVTNLVSHLLFIIISIVSIFIIGHIKYLL